METLIVILVLVALFSADYIPRQMRKNKIDEMVKSVMGGYLLQDICSWQRDINTEEKFLVSYRDPFAIKVIEDFQIYISRKAAEQDIWYDDCKSGKKYFVSVYLEKYLDSTQKYNYFEKGLLTDQGLAIYRLLHTIYLVSCPGNGFARTLEKEMTKRLEADIAPPPKPKRARKPKNTTE